MRKTAKTKEKREINRQLMDMYNIKKEFGGEEDRFCPKESEIDETRNKTEAERKDT